MLCLYWIVNSRDMQRNTGRWWGGVTCNNGPQPDVWDSQGFYFLCFREGDLRHEAARCSYCPTCLVIADFKPVSLNVTDFCLFTGDVSPISMSPISQSQFIPLGEVLLLAISAMNSAHKPVTQEALTEHLQTCFPGNTSSHTTHQPLSITAQL